jgi:hypothetical protein
LRALVDRAVELAFGGVRYFWCSRQNWKLPFSQSGLQLPSLRICCRVRSTTQTKGRELMRMMLRTHIDATHGSDALKSGEAKGNLRLHREIQAGGDIFRPRKRPAKRLFRLRHGRLSPMPRGCRGVFRYRLRYSSVAVHDPGRSSTWAGGRRLTVSG